jgi:Cdc6-like AAA superfamily ATPase
MAPKRPRPSTVGEGRYDNPKSKCLIEEVKSGISNSTFNFIKLSILSQLSRLLDSFVASSSCLPSFDLHSSQTKQVKIFLEGVINGHENNSIVLVGNGNKIGSLQLAIREFMRTNSNRNGAVQSIPSTPDRKDHPRKDEPSSPFRLVWLDGLLTSDDASALREISRQLSLDIFDVHTGQLINEESSDKKRKDGLDESPSSSSSSSIARASPKRVNVDPSHSLDELTTPSSTPQSNSSLSSKLASVRKRLLPSWPSFHPFAKQVSLDTNSIENEVSLSNVALNVLNANTHQYTTGSSAPLPGLSSKRPSEILGMKHSGGVGSVNGMRSSFENHLQFLIKSLKDGRAGKAPILLIISNFDIFAKKSKQTLLYNLLDLTQDSSAHLGLIGVSTKLNIIEMLEKRLKSRFSHQQIVFSAPSPSEYLQMFRKLLLIEENSSQYKAGTLIENEIQVWNKSISHLVGSDVSEMIAQQLWQTSASIPSILQSLKFLVSQLTLSSWQIHPETFSSSLESAISGTIVTSTHVPDLNDDSVTPMSRLQLIPTLSVLELCWIAVMVHIYQRSKFSSAGGAVSAHQQSLSDAVSTSFLGIYREYRQRFGSKEKLNEKTRSNETTSPLLGSMASIDSTEVSLSSQDTEWVRYSASESQCLMAFKQLLLKDLIRFVPASVSAGGITMDDIIYTNSKAANVSFYSGAEEVSVNLTSIKQDLKSKADIRYRQVRLTIQEDDFLAVVNTLDLPYGLKEWISRGGTNIAQ